MTVPPAPTADRAGLRASLASPQDKQRYVRRLFATIADRYDLITGLLSYGQDRRWKRRVIRLANAGPGMAALDLACGTGDLAYGLQGCGARTTALDVTPRMLELAAAKQPRGNQPGWIAGDMMALPFPAARFDLVTTGYGLRNVPVLQEAIDEIHRVLKPGGLFLSLDFNRPSNPLVRGGYLAYLTIVGSSLGFALHGDPDTYRYIPESIKRYPGAVAVCGLLRERGFSRCEYLPVLGGLMAIHRAVKT
jgi:ubiquinone/menaquinone biosynthesis methyltransferase